MNFSDFFFPHNWWHVEFLDLFLFFLSLSLMQPLKEFSIFFPSHERFTNFVGFFLQWIYEFWNLFLWQLISEIFFSLRPIDRFFHSPPPPSPWSIDYVHIPLLLSQSTNFAIVSLGWFTKFTVIFLWLINIFCEKGWIKKSSKEHQAHKVVLKNCQVHKAGSKRGPQSM